MRALLAAEALKLRTTHAWIGVTAAVTALVGIAAAAIVGAASERDLGSPELSSDLVSASRFSGFFASLLAVVALVVALAVGVPWLAARGSSLAVDSDLLELALRVLVSSALWGALGVCAGALIGSQTAALVVGLVWILVVENLLVALLGLLDAGIVADLLPGRALAAFEGSADDALPALAGAAVALAWIAVLGVLGAVGWRVRT